MALLSQEDSVLMVIDMQGNLYESMQDKPFLLENVRKLIRGMQVFGIPVIVTEQIPEKLGPTIEPVVSLLPDAPRIPKSDFSCCGDEKIMKALKAAERRQVLLCGIETHVCVYQTARDLLARGLQVAVAADAVSSQSVRDREIALQRMRDIGAQIMTAEMIMFEVLREARTPDFQRVAEVLRGS